MSQSKYLITLMYIFIFSEPLFAGSDSYSCRIIHTYDTTDDGLLRTSGFHDSFKGGEFTVLKSTGAISGDTLTTLRAVRTQVINYGSGGNSFKAVAYFDGQVQVIEVQEFKGGAEKPFIAISMGGAGIVTGMCK